MEFFEILDNYLSEKKITNYKMSAETGISSSLIGYWRRGQRKPTLDNIIAISNYLDVTTDFLLKGKSVDIPKLRDGERELLELVHDLSDKEQQRVIGVVESYLNQRKKASKTVIDLPNPLPSIDDGIRELKQEKLLEAFKNTAKPVK